MSDDVGAKGQNEAKVAEPKKAEAPRKPVSRQKGGGTTVMSQAKAAVQPTYGVRLTREQHDELELLAEVAHLTLEELVAEMVAMTKEPVFRRRIGAPRGDLRRYLKV